MPRLILILVVVFIGWYFWNKLQSLPPEKRKGQALSLTLWFILGVTLLMVVTGKAPVIVAAIAALGPLLKGLLNLAVRTFPLLQAWLKSRQPNPDQGTARGGEIDINEAYLLLGLKPGATREDVIHAHKRLIQKNHPDMGGNDYLAAKLNSAKELLLKHIK